MASPKLEDIFSECGLSPNLASDLLAEGWTTTTFAFSVWDEQGFDQSITELCVAHGDVSLLQKAALRIFQIGKARNRTPHRPESSLLKSCPRALFFNIQEHWSQLNKNIPWAFQWANLGLRPVIHGHHDWWLTLPFVVWMVGVSSPRKALFQLPKNSLDHFRCEDHPRCFPVFPGTLRVRTNEWFCTLKNAVWSVSVLMGTYIFIWSPLSGPHSAPLGGHDWVVGFFVHSMAWSGSVIVVCCMWTPLFFYIWLLKSCRWWGTMLSIFCQITQIPISWEKSELGARIQWIGWLIIFRAGTISIPQQKIDKLTSYLHEMLKSSKTSRRALEKLIGLLMCLTQIFPLMRIWIHHLYQDLYTVPATHLSIDAGDWPRLHDHLSDELTCISRPHHSQFQVVVQL